MKLATKLIGSAAAMIAVSIAQAAVAGPVYVSGLASIWLAGQPTGAQTSGYFGTDTAPEESPVMVSFSGPSISFVATGLSSVDGACFAGANGGCYGDQSGDSPSPWSADYNGPATALVGIFTDGTVPTLENVDGYVGPEQFVPGLDYQNPANIGPGLYSPSLDQIFLIGDGSGETFYVPTGATELFLAVGDSLGASANNSGGFLVNTGVPEPSTWAMMLLGFGVVGSAARARRKHVSVTYA